MALPPITGQKTPKGIQTYATHLLAPVVALADLSDVSNPINDNTISGKQEGAWVITKALDGTLSIAVAAGSLPTDKWYPATAGSKVTPA